MTDKTLEEILNRLDELESTAAELAGQILSDTIGRPANSRNWILTIYQEDKPIQNIPLVKTLHIGRLDSNDILIKDPRISRQHARIELMEGRPRIVDLDSGNGTFVNGERITGPVLLDEGAIVALGSTRLKVISGIV
ncbi:MAG: FHA domain-containing protein [Anaerolineales bacterium]|nr:FHA domain-containing protein [Anaerolineales bacterium]